MVWVRKCMWVMFIQTKNGVSASCWRLMKSMHAPVVSSSMVSIRFLVSGPVSSMRCLPTGPYRSSTSPLSLSVAQEWMTPRGRSALRSSGASSSVG